MPVATAPIRPLAWEPPYAEGAAQEKAKRQKKEEEEVLSLELVFITHFEHLPHAKSYFDYLGTKPINQPRMDKQRSPAV